MFLKIASKFFICSVLNKLTKFEFNLWEEM